MQNKTVRLPTLTIASGIAAMLVAIHHASATFGVFPFVGGIGWIGISCFFILSGFLLSWNSNPEQTLRSYYVERLAKIYPLHVITLCVSLMAFIVLKEPLAGYVGTRWGTVANFLLIHDWLPGHPNVRQSWNGVSWIVSAEFFFCLLAPFIIGTLAKLSSRRLVDIVAALYFLHLTLDLLAFHKNLDWLLDFMQYHPLARIPEFVYGIVFAIFVRRGVHLRVSWITNIMLFVPLFLYYRVSRDSLNPVLMIDLGIPAFVAIVVSGAVSDLTSRIKGNDMEIFNSIGEASYSFYMTHTLLLGAIAYTLHTFNVEFNAVSTAFLYLIASVVLAIFVNRAIERPARKLILALTGVATREREIAEISAASQTEIQQE